MVVVKTLWGSSHSVDTKPGGLVVNGFNFAIYEKADGNFWAVAWNGERTVTTSLSFGGLQRAVDWTNENRTFDNYPLKASPGNQLYVIDSLPSSVAIFADGNFIGDGPVTVELPIGSHSFRFVSKDTEPFTQTIGHFGGEKPMFFLPSLTLIPPTERPPIEPPAEPPIEPPTEPLPFSPFAQLLKHFLGAVPDWWKPIDDFTRWVNENFGMDMTTNLSAENKALYEKLGLSDKILFFGGPMSIQGAAVTTAGKQILGMTAKDILARGLKDPKGLANIIKAVPKEDLARLFGQLTKEVAGRDAIQTIQRVVLDQTAPAITKNALKIAGAAAVGIFGLASTLNFIGFLGEEAIQASGLGVFLLVSNKVWPDAAEQLKEYKKSIDTISAGIEPLTQIPVLSFFLNQWWPNTKKAAYDQVDAFDKVIKEGLAIEETGSISITTNPTKASIWIDGKLNTFPSNTVIDKLVPGTYKIKLELENHVSHEEEVRVATGEQKKVEWDFEPITDVITPRAGRLEWRSEDDKTGATVGVSFFLNGSVVDDFATSGKTDLVPGNYEVRWTAIGYEPEEDTINIELQVTTKLVVKMRKIEAPLEDITGVTCETLGFHTEMPIDGREYEQVPVRGLLCYALKEPTKGRLEISSNPLAEVWLLGNKVADSTPYTADYEQGFYTFILKKEGYLDKTVEVWINAKETTMRVMELTAEDAPTPTTKLARVSVNSNPTGAKILVNGVWTKKYTPDSVLLEAGDYEIALTKSGFKQWSTPLRLVEES